MALMFLNGDGMRGGRAHYTIEGVPPYRASLGQPGSG